ncbi:MAG: hypothetical protein ABSB61_07400 [Anaerolineales bacterium]
MCSWHSFAPAATLRITIASVLLVPLLLGCNFPINQLVGGAQPTTGPTYATQQQSLSNESPSGSSAITPLGPAATQESKDMVWSKCPSGETIDTFLCFKHDWWYPWVGGRSDVRFSTPYCIVLHISTEGGVDYDPQDLRYTVVGHGADPVGTVDMKGYVTDRPQVTGKCIANPDHNKGDYLHLKIHEVWGLQFEHMTYTMSNTVTQQDLTLPAPATPMDNDLDFKVISKGVITESIPIPNGTLVYELYSPLEIPLEPLVTP